MNMMNQLPRKIMNMKNLMAFAFGVILFSSCTKVVTIELEDPDPKLVVESIISDQPQPFSVKLTMTAPYFDDTNPVVSDAIVFISDDLGNIDTLQYNGNGFYLTDGIRQTLQGHTYYLKIIHNGAMYEAESRVPDYKMLVDSISLIYNEASTFIEEGYNVILNGQENASTVDFVRFQFYKNDTLQTDPFKYFISDDIYVNGNYIIAQVPYNYQSGDTARVEVQSIDRSYYKFLYTLSTQAQNTGGPFDTAPANPPTNLSNGALGYFAACSIDWMERVIP
jgi:hypothetical protein